MNETIKHFNSKDGNNFFIRYPKKDIFYKIEIAEYGEDINGNRYLKKDTDGLYKTYTFRDLQVQWSIKKTINVLNRSNTLQLTIYNIAEETRIAIQKTQENNLHLSFNQRRWLKIKIFSNYDPNNLYLIYDGEIQTCISYREEENYITEINAFEIAEESNQNISINYKSPKRNYITKIIQDYIKTNPFLKIGYISSKAEDYFYSVINPNKPLVYSGDFIRFITNFKKLKFYTNNNNIYVFYFDEVANTKTKIISGDTGLLGSPKINHYHITLKMLFEPSLTLNEKIAFYFKDKQYDYFTSNSLKQTRYVFSYTHNCMIAGNIRDGKGYDADIIAKYGVSGNCFTEATFMILPNDRVAKIFYN